MGEGGLLNLDCCLTLLGMTPAQSVPDDLGLESSCIMHNVAQLPTSLIHQTHFFPLVSMLTPRKIDCHLIKQVE